MRAQADVPKLRFYDDPMFKRVMERKDICKGVLERILGKKIEEVTYCNTEQEKRVGPGEKTIRTDSYLVESGGRTYVVEMQVKHNVALPLRFRGYQSILDGSFLKRGADYVELRESYIVFICLVDPFGAGLPVYTVERTCKEQPDLPFDCASHWIALNAAAYGALGKADPLGSLLEYIYTDTVSPDDMLVAEIAAEVGRYNADKEWIFTMMDSISLAKEEARIEGRAAGMAEGRAEGRAEGKAEGLAEGETRYASLVAKLLDDNRLDDLKRANADAEMRNRLFEEYGI